MFPDRNQQQQQQQQQQRPQGQQPEQRGQHLDREGNIVDMQGTVLVPRPVVDYGAGLWQQQQHQQQQQRQMRRAQLYHQRPRGQPPIGSGAISPIATSSAGFASGFAQTQPHSRTPNNMVPQRSRDYPPVSSAAGATESLSLAIPGAHASNTAASPAAQTAHAASASQQQQLFASSAGAHTWQAEDFAAQHDSALGYLQVQQADIGAGGGGAWPAASLPDQQSAAAFAFAQAQPLPQPQANTHLASTPTIILHQHDAFAATSSLPQHDPSTYYTPFPPEQQHLSPVQPHSPYMPQESTMQTPVSPVSAHETIMAEVAQMARKRSHSIMSQQENMLVHGHSRANSVASMSGVSPNDDYPSRASRSFKRPDPPTNEQNKYICEFSGECQGLVFDRKCEWSKHMDKHDRPYRCQHASCAKLQGFTYSGGLLRHEREVHGKHGGPKAQLMCPVDDCKRHTGKGFTRKENLNEHMRRVHSGKDASQSSLYKRDGMDIVPGVDDAETPASRMSDNAVAAAAAVAELEEYATAAALVGANVHKRKRSLADGGLDPQQHQHRSAFDNLDELEYENQRLRQELLEKDAQIRQLQEDGVAQSERVRQLEDQIGRFQ